MNRTRCKQQHAGRQALPAQPHLPRPFLTCRRPRPPSLSSRPFSRQRRVSSDPSAHSCACRLPQSRVELPKVSDLSCPCSPWVPRSSGRLETSNLNGPPSSRSLLQQDFLVGATLTSDDPAVHQGPCPKAATPLCKQCYGDQAMPVSPCVVCSGFQAMTSKLSNNGPWPKLETLPVWPVTALPGPPHTPARQLPTQALGLLPSHSHRDRHDETGMTTPDKEASPPAAQQEPCRHRD